MKTAKIIREERATKIEAMQALHTKAGTEKRSLSKDEQTQWDALNAEVEALKTELRTVEIQEALDAEMAAIRGLRTDDKTGEESKKEKRDLSKYSMLKVIQSRMNETALTGLELEMDQEARSEAKNLGVTINGVGIPSMILEKRDNSITMPTQPEDGSAVMVDKQKYGSMLDMLKNALMTRQLGATYLNDLVGNIALTRKTQRAVATWKPEVGELDKSNIKFGGDDFAPKRLGTYVVQSKQFLMQTSPDVERDIREDILYAIAEGVDLAAIFGTGLNNQPTGILTHAAATDIETIPVGGALTRADIVAAETALLSKNVDGRTLGWLINALTRGALKNTPIATGSDRFIMESNGILLDNRIVMSNALPSNGGVGTNESSAIFGDWRELLIGQWGGIDLLVDPYTLATGGQVKIVAQGFFNVYVRRFESFVALTGITA